MARSSMTVCTERRSVNGGWTDTSSEATSDAVSRSPRSWTVRIDWRWSWCIFQLPLTNEPAAGGARHRQARRRGVRCAAQRLEAGEVPVLEQLERRPAAGRDEVDPLRQARAGRGRATEVPAADDGEARAAGHRLGHGGASRPRTARPRRRPWVRSRTRCRAGDAVGEGAPSSRARCRGPRQPAGMSGPTIRPRPSPQPRADGPARPEGHDVGRAARSVAGSVRAVAAQLSMRSASSERRADVVALGGEEGEGHAAADTSQSTRREQRPQHAELVGDLGPAHDRHERPGRRRRAARRGSRPRARGAARRPRAGGPADRRPRRGPGARRRRRRSRTRRTRPRAGRRRRGRWPPRPGSKRRFSSSSTPGASSASRARTGATS